MLGGLGVESLRRRRVRPSQPALRGQLAKAVHDLGVPLIAPGHALAEVGGEPGVAALRAEETTQQRDSHAAERPVVEVMTAVAPAGLEVAGQAGARVRQRVGPIVEVAGLDEPPGPVVIADPARPQARKPSRPASRSSSAIWQPDWPLPTTSTRPGGSSSGLR